MHVCRTRVTHGFGSRWIIFDEQLPVADSLLILFVYQQLFWCMCEPESWCTHEPNAYVKLMYVWTETWFCRDDICSVKSYTISWCMKRVCLCELKSDAKYVAFQRVPEKDSDIRNQSANFHFKKDLVEHIWTKFTHRQNYRWTSGRARHGQ